MAARTIEPRAIDAHHRVRVLRAHGATTATLPQLLAYTRNEFAIEAVNAELPLPDEPFVDDWREYLADAEHESVWSSLRERLVQLRFPISAGISQTEEYIRATRQGFIPHRSRELELERPEALTLLLHETPAGRVPVIVAPTRSDFVSLVRALVHRNEPMPIPDSMGACIVAGYTNWDRVNKQRARWRAGEAFRECVDWPSALGTLARHRDLYQDRFLVLSRGPYSNVSASSLGLGEAEWLSLSFTIRLEHECAHYFTRRVFGKMKSALHDELIADYCGISAALGHFRADWFLRFMGLENFPEYRRGGRLENYRGNPPLSEEGFEVLVSLVGSATRTLEGFNVTQGGWPTTSAGRGTVVMRLARTNLEVLAEPAKLDAFGFTASRSETGRLVPE